VGVYEMLLSGFIKFNARTASSSNIKYATLSLPIGIMHWYQSPDSLTTEGAASSVNPAGNVIVFGR
jgi:hypothetical protein